VSVNNQFVFPHIKLRIDEYRGSPVWGLAFVFSRIAVLLSRVLSAIRPLGTVDWSLGLKLEWSQSAVTHYNQTVHSWCKWIYEPQSVD